MVEEVSYVENKFKPDKTTKDLTIGFYFWNLNLFLVSLLTFESWIVKIILYLVVMTFIFKEMFGIVRFQRVIFWNIVVIILYFVYFNGWLWHYILVLITIIINLAYYHVVIKNVPRK